MPQLPAYQSQMAAQANRRIIEQPTFAPDTSMADAAMKVAQIGMEISQRVEKANTDREVITATRLAREQYAKTKFELENDQQIKDEDILPTLRKRGEEIIGKTGEGIRSADARRLWQENLNGTLLLDGDDWARKEQTRRGVDRVRGGHIAAASQMEASAGDLTISAADYESNLNDERTAIARSRQLGFIDEETKARLEAQLNALGVKDRTMRFTANIDALVKDGKVAEAEAQYQAQMGLNREGKSTVDPDILAKIKSGLDQSKQEFAAIEKGDKFWAAAKGNYGKYMELVSGLQDVPLRKKLEERGAQLAQQAKAAREANQDMLERSMWSHVEGGGTIMNAPPSLRSAIDPDRLGSIRAYENARDAEKGMSPAMKAAWIDQSADFKSGFEWFARNNPPVFMGKMSEWPADIRARYEAMTPDDQRAVSNLQLEMQDKGKTSDSADKVMQDALNEAKRFAPSIMGLKADDPKRVQFEGILYRNSKLQAAMQGGNPITPDQARKLVLQTMGEYDTKKYGEGVNVALGYMQADEAAVEDPEMWARVAAQQEARLGRKPTKLEIMQAYQAVTGN